MTIEGEREDELRARRARVFREVRDSERRHNAEVKRQFEAERAAHEKRRSNQAGRIAVPSGVWAAAIAASLKGAPAIGNTFGVSSAVAFTVLGTLIGVAAGSAMAADNAPHRAKHALVVGLIHLVIMGGVSWLSPMSYW